MGKSSRANRQVKHFLKKSMLRIEIEQRLVQFLHERPAMQKYDTPQRLMALLAAEVEEAQQELWDDGQPPTPEHLAKLKYEVADIAIYLITLSASLDIDIGEAMQEKIDLNEQRFPKELFQDGQDFLASYLARKKDLGEAKE